MKLIYFAILISALTLSACSSSKPATDYSDSKYQNKTGLTGDKLRNALVKEAKNWTGVKYKNGGENRKGIDCSGLVLNIYKNVAGYKLPRNSAEQQKHTKPIKKQDLKRGDLVFFAINSKKVNHVGIFIGDGEIIHASKSRGVTTDKLSDKYYVKHFHSAGRVEALFSRKKNKSTKQENSVAKLKSKEILDDVISQKLDSIYN